MVLCLQFHGTLQQFILLHLVQIVIQCCIMLNTTLCFRLGGWGCAGLIALMLIGCSTSSAALREVRWDALEDVGNLGRVSSIEVSPFDSGKIVAGGDVLGAGITDDGGVTWQQTIGFTNYEDNDITFHPTDPNIIWIGTLGGAYKSTDGGKTWIVKRDGMPPASTATITAPIERVIFDPNNSNTLLAVAGNHRHMNYGKKGITAYGGVWKSIDGGDHWNQIATIDDPRQQLKEEYDPESGGHWRQYPSVGDAGVN